VSQGIAESFGSISCLAIGDMCADFPRLRIRSPSILGDGGICAGSSEAGTADGEVGDIALSVECFGGDWRN
jgi:hypothetical protein